MAKECYEHLSNNKLKITTIHNDSRFNDADFRTNCGSFSIILFNLEKGLKELGYWTDDIDSADWVVGADSLATDLNIPGKRCAQINFQDTISLIPSIALHRKKHNSNLKLVSLNQHTADLWNKYGISCGTIEPSIDGDFWKPTDCKDHETFTFIWSSFSNSRSGLEILLRSWDIAFRGYDKVKLIIKATTDNPKLEQTVRSINSGNIIYINKRMTFSELRGLYSRAKIAINVYRFSGHGLPIGEFASLDVLNLVGNFDPSNKIADERFARFLAPTDEIEISNITGIARNVGLTDTFGGLQWDTPPKIYNYSVVDYSRLLWDVYQNYEKYSQHNMHEAIKEKWNITRSAQNLIDYLESSS